MYTHIHEHAYIYMHTHKFLNSTSPPYNWTTVDMHKQEEELNAGHEHDKANILALNSKLKPGGYIKIGLYSKLARQIVTAARELIKSLGIQSTPKGIRDFSKRIFNADQPELKNLSNLVNDFYSLS